MKEIKIIARKNLPINFVLFTFQCAVVWLFLDKFNISKTNQIWIGSLLIILFVVLIGIGCKTVPIDIFKENKSE